MKKVLLILLSGIFSMNTGFSEGTEPTDEDNNGKREVSSLEHLLWISTNSVGLDYDYEQTTDIDATVTQYWDDSDDDSDGNFYNDPNDLTADGSNEGWLPMGNSSSPFTGTYDGMGFKITGLTINRAADFQGFIAQTNNAEIQNLGLEGANISGGRYTGGFIGIISSSIVSNCYSDSKVSGDIEVGGITGRNYASVLINCYATGDVNGNDKVGGLVGYNRANSSVSICFASGKVSASLDRVGGLIGYNNESSVDSCYALGDVIGYQHVGGLVGNNQSSTIKKCFATGTVTGWQNVGGITGNLWQGEIIISYATGKVNSTGNNAGGLVGYIYGTSNVENCYSLGDVNRTAGSDTIFGAFIGYNHPSATISHNYSTGSVYFEGVDDPTDNGFVGLDQGTVYEHNFWDSQVSNQTGAVGAIPVPSVNMRYSVTFTGGGWDFTGETANGTDDIWTMASGTEASYPYLSSVTQDTIPGLLDLIFTGGDGTSENPYQVENLTQLNFVRYNLDASYILVADIDASETSNWDDGNGGDPEGWGPISHYYRRFTGSFNGKNHKISGIYIYRPNQDYIGLFGYIEGGEIDSLGVENTGITGDYYVGGITGYSRAYSNISSCYVSGEVSGLQDVGGLVGFNEYSSINNCYTDVSVSGRRVNTGGLVGTTYHFSEVHNCFSRGDVTRLSDIYDSFGSFIGHNSGGTIDFSYSTGSVFFKGTEDPTGKGFIGADSDGTFNSNFFDNEASNQNTAIGATPKSTSEMSTQATFLTAGWDFMAENTNGTDDIWGINPEDNDGYPFLKLQGYKLLTEVTEWPSAASLACGQKLSESVLTGGSASVEGSFAFSDPEAIPAFGTNDYEMIFAPSDPDNYAQLTAMVSVTVEDYLDPEITSTHNDQVLNASEGCGTAIPDYTVDVIATDICDPDLSITQVPAPGTSIEGAANSVTITVVDKASNSAEVSFNVGVVDITDPVITSTHEDQVLEAGLGCEASLPTYTGDLVASDNCESELTITQNPEAGSNIVGSSNLVTLEAMDNAGNTAEISFNVSVEDLTPPDIECAGDQEVDSDASGTYNVTGTEFDPIEVSDNCTLSGIENDFNNESSLDGAEFTEGTTTVVWTATDISGNTNTCSFEVTVSSSTGKNKFPAGVISVFPNPVEDVIRIESNRNYSTEKVNISITDLTGKVFKKITMKQDKNITINVSELEKGIYFITLSDDECVVTRKMIKN